MRTADELKQILIKSYKDEIAMCWKMGESEPERAEEWMHIRTTYEFLVTCLETPNYYDKGL